MQYEVHEQVVPGITLVKSDRSKNLIARIYKAETQETLNRSTGTDDLKEAKKWVMPNLGTLFSLEATPRGGGNNSIKRLLSLVMWSSFVRDNKLVRYQKQLLMDMPSAHGISLNGLLFKDMKS